MTTFVSVGNTRRPFSRLLNEVERLAHSLPQPVVVQYGHTPFSSDSCVGKDFLEMTEFQSMVCEAELVIMQAGVGGILTAVDAGKIPIIVPRLSTYGEHIDDHQLEFGQEVSRSGKVVLVEDIVDLLDAANHVLSEQRVCTSNFDEPKIVSLVSQAIDQVAAKEL